MAVSAEWKTFLLRFSLPVIIILVIWFTTPKGNYSPIIPVINRPGEAKTETKTEAKVEARIEIEPYIPDKSRSKQEEICKKILFKLFKKNFKTVRPSFIKNPKTGRNLELDCYNEQLKIAVEYNGIQHYEYPNFTRVTKQEFDEQIYRDKIKAKRCLEEGIKLVVVPYTVTGEESIENFLREKLINYLT